MTEEAPEQTGEEQGAVALDKNAPFLHEHDLYSPYLEHPTIADAEAFAAETGCDTERALRHLLTLRNRIIRAETNDPLQSGYRPPIWVLCWALLDVPWQDKALNQSIRERLGFKERVQTLVIMGDNRGGKTTFMMMTISLLMWHVKKCETWSMQTTHEKSVSTHHRALHDFLPPKLRRAGKILSETTAISYSRKEGFTGGKFVLPNLSAYTALNYSMGPPSPLESGNPNAIAADEEMPADLAERAEVRVAASNGFFILGYTPINGYSATVRTYYHGATVVLDAPAYLLPADGGPALPGAQLGLTEAEFEDNRVALKRKEQPIWPLSRPPSLEEILNCALRIEHLRQRDPAAKIEERKFQRMPRVLKTGVNGEKAIVHFHSGDNPFGTPSNVVGLALSMPDDRKKMTVYGYATKSVTNCFGKFDEHVHVVKAKDIPAGGTNWHIVDPSNARPFFQLWRRDTPDGKIFIYREWPGNYAIPGLGFLGAWAEQGGADKKFDGKRGPAQRAINWGAARYKEEIARLEGWQLAATERPATMNYQDWVASWGEQGPAAEKIHERFLDARFGAVNNIQAGGIKSLLETFDDVGLTFAPTNAVIDNGDNLDEGLQLINDALDFDATRPVDFFNHPRLFISEECVNLIFALKLYTGLDKGDGATKDPIDTLRYSFKVDCKWVEERPDGSGGRRGRGCY